MSFGWSAGDIVTVLRLLYKVGVALKEAGGASSQYQDTNSFLQTLTRTLEHLNALQSTNLDASVASNLRELCDQIKVPLEGFLRDVGKYQPALGGQNKRSKIFSAPRKLQWALSASKEAKKLQERVAVPMAAVGLVLGQQIVQNTLQMPADIQARMSNTLDSAIDTKIRPFTESIKNNIESLATANTLRAEDVLKRMDHCHNRVAEDGKIHTLEVSQMRTALQTRLDSVIKTQAEGNGAISQSLNSLEGQSSGLRDKMDDILKQQSASTDLVLRTVSLTEKQMRKITLTRQSYSSKLHQKLNDVDASMQAIQGSLHLLSRVSHHRQSDISNNEMQAAVQDILSSIWLFLSSLQFLVRQLLVLLAPYLLALYRGSMQMFILHGDRFFFEDALGRIKRLPCVEFQHWNTFHNFLVGSFGNEPGLAFVLGGNFMIMNGYNNSEIEQETWRAVIQPNTRVKMAILLDSALIQRGRCPDFSCDGRVPVTSTSMTQICPVCGKHFLKAEKSVTFNRTVTEIESFTQRTASGASQSRTELVADGLHLDPVNSKVNKITPQGETNLSREISDLVRNPMTLATLKKEPAELKKLMKDLTAFKRVAWRAPTQLSDDFITYACTFLDCDREFTSAPYWIVHENTHPCPDQWRCPQNINPWNACAFVTSNEPDFKMHLRKVHRMAMVEWIDELAGRYHLGPGSGTYWDGFCKEVRIGNNLTRLSHIEDRLRGTISFPQKSFQDWYPLNSQLSKREIQEAIKEEKSVRRELEHRGIMRVPKAKFPEEFSSSPPHVESLTEVAGVVGLARAASESLTEEALKYPFDNLRRLSTEPRRR